MGPAPRGVHRLPGRPELNAAAATATLAADGGGAAASADFFRSPGFLAAEGATHTLRVGSPGRTALVPLCVREIAGAGGLLDATSPYGYPGGLVEGDGPAPEPAAVDWSQTGLVSIFARERIGGEPWLAGARQRSEVLVHDPSRPRRLRPRLAGQVRSAERDGWSVERLEGPRSSASERAAFARAYAETMTRARAAERYFFEPAYFDAALGFESAWLLLARDGAGEPGAGAIAALSDGLLHYFLGGTADAALAASPFKCVVVAMLDLADELGVALNLGGGVRPGDGLEAFKRGFANGSLPFRTHELVCDPPAYERLAAGREADGFFPAYRAP